MVNAYLLKVKKMTKKNPDVCGHRKKDDFKKTYYRLLERPMFTPFCKKILEKMHY
jgi:hypothetical protein